MCSVLESTYYIQILHHNTLYRIIIIVCLALADCWFDNACLGFLQIVCNMYVPVPVLLYVYMQGGNETFHNVHMLYNLEIKLLVTGQ